MRRIAVFGAGLAGISFIKTFRKGSTAADIILVDPKDYVEIPFAMPRALVAPEALGPSPRRPITEMLDVEHRQAKLAELRADSALLDDGGELRFDTAVLATGSTIRGFGNLKVAETRSLDERTREWQAEHDRLVDAGSVVVIGGGPIGVELASEIGYTFPDKQLTLIHATDRLLPALGEGVGKKARRVLEEMGARVVLGHRAEVAEDGRSVTLDDGEAIEADLVYTATGIALDTSYMTAHFAGALDDRGRIRVDQYLRVVGHEHIYAVGDINDVPGIKLGAFAGQQGDRAAGNVAAALSGGSMKLFKGTTRAVGLVTLGQKAGVFKAPIGRFDPMHRMKQRDFFVPRYLG